MIPMDANENQASKGDDDSGYVARDFFSLPTCKLT